jgi:hypothetical protein
MCLPLLRATSSALLMDRSPSKTARKTLCALPVPSDLVRMSCTPIVSMTARTAPPAMTPVPCEAGFMMTWPAP